jgi:hypothetical protein
MRQPAAGCDGRRDAEIALTLRRRGCWSRRMASIRDNRRHWNAISRSYADMLWVAHKP